MDKTRLRKVPDCFINTGKPCAKHLEEEIQYYFKNGSPAVTVCYGRISHVNAIQLLVEPCEFSEGCYLVNV